MKQDLKQEVTDKYESIIFEGTTHVCEAMVVVLHYVTGEWVKSRRFAT